MITNSYFTDNIAKPNGSDGGALYAYGAGIIVKDSYFSDNMAEPRGSNGGAIFIKGASTQSVNQRDIKVADQSANVTISGNTFEYNRATDGGGGAIYSGVQYSIISLIKNTFSHNTATNCGAVQISEP